MRVPAPRVGSISTLLLAAFVLHGVSKAGAETYSVELVEKARQAGQYYKQKYWDCLVDETVKKLSTKINAEDLRSYLKGACAAEKQDFKVPFVDYMAMLYPDISLQDAFAAFDTVVQAAVDDAVSGFVQRKASK